MDRTYKKIELVGISSDSYEKAIKDAVEKASKSLHGLAWFEVSEQHGKIVDGIHGLAWFEVSEQHGKIVDGKVAEFQVVLKVAFKLD
jgi:flavin-binding protein dodecin